MWKITANAGFESNPMTYHAAMRYAGKLRRYGNYDVKVVRA